MVQEEAGAGFNKSKDGPVGGLKDMEGFLLDVRYSGCDHSVMKGVLCKCASLIN